MRGRETVETPGSCNLKYLKRTACNAVGTFLLTSVSWVSVISCFKVSKACAGCGRRAGQLIAVSQAGVIGAVGWGQGRCWITGGIGVALWEFTDAVCGGLVLTAVVSWNGA